MGDNSDIHARRESERRHAYQGITSHPAEESNQSHQRQRTTAAIGGAAHSSYDVYAPNTQALHDLKNLLLIRRHCDGEKLHENTPVVKWVFSSVQHWELLHFCFMFFKIRQTASSFIMRLEQQQGSSKKHRCKSYIMYGEWSDSSSNGDNDYGDDQPWNVA